MKGFFWGKKVDNSGILFRLTHLWDYTAVSTIENKIETLITRFSHFFTDTVLLFSPFVFSTVCSSNVITTAFQIAR